MGNVTVSNFNYGLDRRRPRAAAAPGTLWTAANCQISRGGDVERLKAFVPEYVLPAGTFGLGQVAGQLYVFGSTGGLAALCPPDVIYLRLDAETGANMVRVLAVGGYQGKPYIIAEYDDGGIRHFYSTTRITDWDTLADANWTVNTVTQYLADKLILDGTVEVQAAVALITVRANVPGTPFTLAVSSSPGGQLTKTVVQPNVAAVAEVRSAGSLTVTGGTFNPGVNTIQQVLVGATPLLTIPVDWLGSNGATAAAIAVQINNHSTVSGYSASAIGAVVTIRAAPGTGATPNGSVVSFTAIGNATATVIAMAGGVTAVAAVAQVVTVAFGTPTTSMDPLNITLNGVAYIATGRASGMGTSLYVALSRIYSSAGTLLEYDVINAPLNWHGTDVHAGAGFIDLSSQSDGALRLTGVAVYQNYAAIFSARQVTIFSLNADATQAFQFQSLSNTGAIAPKSIVAFGNQDTYYLDTAGVRSLRARDASNSAILNSVGAPMDAELQTFLATLSAGQAAAAFAVIEPVDGRYWIAIGPRIYILSNFPDSKITAWTYYEGITFSDFAATKSRVWARSGDTVYLYGGRNGQTYPSGGAVPITLDLPFMDANDVGRWKEWTAFDAICSGTWGVTWLVNPADESKTVQIGNIVGTTFGNSKVKGVGRSSMAALRLTCASDGPATFSKAVLYFDEEEART